MTTRIDHNPVPDDAELIEALGTLRANRAPTASRSQARSAVARLVAESQGGAPRPPTLLHRLPLLASFALIPLMGVGVVGAAVGGGLPGPVASILNAVAADDAHENAKGCDDVNPAVQGTPTPGGPADCVAGSSGDHRRNGTTSAGSPAPEGDEAADSDDGEEGSRGAEAAHANGKGCDDVNPAVHGTPTPGGPVGCTVGNSGDHRQNGKGKSTPEPAATATPGEAPADADSKGADAAHANGKGCDDVNPAVQGTPTPGGPVGCTVGNSGDHRQNGKSKSTPTPEPTATASPAAATGPSGGSAAADRAHADGNGCDDVNPAIAGDPARGGPVDCASGNSGDHRRNGRDKPATQE